MPRRDLPRFIAAYQAVLFPVDKLLTSTIQLAEINSVFDSINVFIFRMLTLLGSV